MSQTVITQAFETLKAQEAANGGIVTLDEFVFASVPNLNITDPIDRTEGLPPAAQIVHRQAVSKTGMVNSNAVVYSVVLGADVGDFEFNWVGLLNKASGVVAMIVHAPSQKKIRTQSGQQGNVLTRSFLMEYNGASQQTQIITPADTWQIDFTARLNGVDERIRLENIDSYGDAAFIADGFKVVNDGGQYRVTKGVAYIAGLRAQMLFDQDLVTGGLPSKIWLDVSWTGTLTSVWNTSTKLTVAAELADYTENDDVHRVYAIAEIHQDGTVTDLRPGSVVTAIPQLDVQPNTFFWLDGQSKLQLEKITEAGRSLLRHESVPDLLFYMGLNDASRAEAGDALLAVKSVLPGAVTRTQHDKNADVVSIKDFGAVGDGATDDTAAVQAALDSGRDIFIPAGIFVCTQELEVLTHGQRIYGAGRGYGYNSNQVKLENGVIIAKWSSAVFNWRHVSTLLFKGAGIKRRRTRVLHRSSATDPQDDALSVCLNIQAEGTSLEHFCVFLDVTPPVGGADAEKTDSIDNLGANWDIGIFVGCRQNTNFNRMGVIGYHRKANVWYDVTQAINLPRFNSWRTGEQYPQGPVENGADGCASDGLFTSGGLWGVNVQGAKPKTGETTYSASAPYYDAILGEAVEDVRGSWGFSDFLMINCQIFGANHHTRRRLVDMKAVPNAKNDWDVGGAFSIDGITKNVSNALHGHRFVGCRFQSHAPFSVRIDRSARDAFFGCMIENPYFDVVTARDGSRLTLSPATTFYGLCATDRHRFLTITEGQAPVSSAYTQWKFGDSQFANSSESFPITRTPYGRLEVLAEDGTDKSVLRLGTVESPSSVEVFRSILGSAIISTNGAFVYQNVAGDLKLQVAPSGNVITYGSIYPAQDNTFANGMPGFRWTNVHAASSTIVTSDARMKADKEPISDAVLRAWGKVNFMQFRLTDAIAKKGEDARIHFGVIAQDVKAAFESEGLDPFVYGVLCYDEWGNTYEPVLAKREVVRDGVTETEEYDTGEVHLVKEAGNRYGIRYEEALVLECAYLRWRLGNVDA